MIALVRLNDMYQFYKSEYRANLMIKQYSNWFPVFPSVKLAGIIADLMSDGHLQGDPKWKIDYTSNSKKELNLFGDEVFSLFQKKGKIRTCNTNNYGTMNYGVNCKMMARILNLCGAPSGAKVLKKFNIPEWIISDKTYFKRFISRLFSGEGTVDQKYNFIEIQMHKSTNLIADGKKFFTQIKDNLEKHFGIITTNPFTDTVVSYRKDGIQTKPIRLKIKRKQSLIDFAKHIGFEDNNKQQKLIKVISKF
ncbi:hypothetical protein GF358_01830 [Candidatus Woesearchaeota archaeon]|nr:hypothetical protein [Candidatus Woesearchaeota archaeon]